VVDVPEPVLRKGGILVRTSHSLISVGTESSALAGGGKSQGMLLETIRNPNLLRKVIDRVSTHGIKDTVELVRRRIFTAQAAGYSCAGVVVDVAPDVTRFRPGDRIGCAGGGYANHAAVNFVSQHLAVKIPESISFEEASFTTLAAIALQGVRRCAPQLGERIVVLGLGLVGQLTVQLLRACGAETIGVDLRKDRVERAVSLGMPHGFSSRDRDLIAGVLERTEGRGADAVIVTAAGGDAGLLNRAFDACRKKGRLILVGDVPIRIHRDKIYKKELDFLISTSYGPGRYDPEYEENGIDYPFAYVRWTEGRNLEEVMRLLASGILVVRPLIDLVYPVEKAPEAYAALASEPRPIGVLLDYHLGSAQETGKRIYCARRALVPVKGASRVGVIGYGNYFRAVLLPLLRKHSGFTLRTVCARTGLRVSAAVENDGFALGTTDYHDILADPDIDVVFVATRHDQHYIMSKAAIEAGKAVWVEKPMTMTVDEGRDLADLVAEKKALLTVGFNRRFSPHAQRLKELLESIDAPKVMIYRVNAGPLPEDHWLLDPQEGGGRILGEGVHFFDFLAFLAGKEVVHIAAISPRERFRDEAIVSLEFADGSVGSVIYAGSGSPHCGKERIEVFAGGVTAFLDDFRSLKVYGHKSKGLTTLRIEKGQREQLENFYQALGGKSCLGVTAEDGYRATVCAHKAMSSILRPLI
jgi:predicted dehydrogenase/threonine dehydrogenase-like Zn-dependent dehydrogenase